MGHTGTGSYLSLQPSLGWMDAVDVGPWFSLCTHSCLDLWGLSSQEQGNAASWLQYAQCLLRPFAFLFPELFHWSLVSSCFLLPPWTSPCSAADLS